MTITELPGVGTDEAWDGFADGPWTDSIDVRDFIQRNYTPYAGDASFLAGPTAKTLRTWDTLEREYLSVERARRVYDVDTHTPADVDAFPAGYISGDDDVVVGLQTDVPLKRAMMPNGTITAPSRKATRQPQSVNCCVVSRLASTVPTMPAASTAVSCVIYCSEP